MCATPFLFLLAFLTLFAHGVACANEHTAESDSIKRIAWNAAPKYIQTQARNLVLHCTEGTLTPDHTHILRYASPKTKESHYVMDFGEWHNQPLTVTCSFGGGVLCDGSGCLMMAYTQIDGDTWKTSLRARARKLNITKVESEDITVPVVEMTQAFDQCRFSGSKDCVTRFTWYGGKFRYFGFGEINKTEPVRPDTEETDGDDEKTEE